MPMDRSRYPADWDAIALHIKELAKWQCQECGRDCSDPKSKPTRSERARHTLTVHHQDFTPENNSPENLIALCSACHLAKHARGRGNVSSGQLSLFEKT